MNSINHTFQIIAWQQLLIQAQELALKMPELGLNTNALALLPIDQLTGVLVFLKRSYAEKQAL